MRQKQSNPQPSEVVLGGQKIAVGPLMVMEGIELCLLLGPYLPKLFKAAETLIREGEPEDKIPILHELVDAMKEFPGDLMKMIGIVVDRRPEWIAQNATAEEAIESLVVIAKIINLNHIITIGASLGLIKFEEDDDARRRRITRNFER